MLCNITVGSFNKVGAALTDLPDGEKKGDCGALVTDKSLVSSYIFIWCTLKILHDSN